MTQAASEDDRPAAGIARGGDLIGDGADQRRAKQIVRPVLHCQHRDEPLLLAGDGRFFHHFNSCSGAFASIKDPVGSGNRAVFPGLQPVALTSTLSSCASNSQPTAVTRSSPNWPNRDEGRSYSKTARPALFS